LICNIQDIGSAPIQKPKILKKSPYPESRGAVGENEPPLLVGLDAADTKVLPRDRPCLSLHEHIPVSQPQHCDRSFIAASPSLFRKVTCSRMAIFYTRALAHVKEMYIL
jgi:hypothetical protein